MIPLCLIHFTVNVAVIAVAYAVGAGLYKNGFELWAMAYGVVMTVTGIRMLSNLLNNLSAEWNHRKSHYSDMPAYRWLDTRSEIYSYDKNGRPLKHGSMRRRYR